MPEDFSPIDFPNYAEMTYGQLRPIMGLHTQPSTGDYAELLRGTLSRKGKRRFDAMTGHQVHSLVYNYIDLNMTRESLLDEMFYDDE